MFGMGVPELILIFAVALIVFGPRRLPEIGKTLGKALGEFKKATDDLKNTIERETQLEEIRQMKTSLTAPLDSFRASLTGLATGTTVSRPEPSSVFQTSPRAFEAEGGPSPANPASIAPPPVAASIRGPARPAPVAEPTAQPEQTPAADPVTPAETASTAAPHEGATPDHGNRTNES